jgi:hypothetical protein
MLWTLNISHFVPLLTVRNSLGWGSVSNLFVPCSFFLWTAKMFREVPHWVPIYHRPAAAGSPLLLGECVANNDMNTRKCWAAMVQFIFWKAYLSSAEKQEEVSGSPQFSFDLCTRIGCHVTMAMSPEAELSVPCSTEREKTGSLQKALWDLSLLGLLHKSYSDSALFQEPLGSSGFPHTYTIIP